MADAGSLASTRGGDSVLISSAPTAWPTASSCSDEATSSAPAMKKLSSSHRSADIGSSGTIARRTRTPPRTWLVNPSAPSGRSLA
jgi:hypothetical protein